MEGTLEELRRISNCPEGATFSQLGLRKSVARLYRDRLCSFGRTRADLSAEPGQGRAQRRAGDLEQPLERPVELEDQEYRARNRQSTDAKDGDHRGVSRREEPEAGEDD